MLSRRYATKPRRIMLGAQAFMLILSLTLALWTWSGYLTPALLLIASFVIGCGYTMYLPAWQASVGDMVPRNLLPSAVSTNSMGFNLARSAGPALGGVVVAAWGPAAAFAVNSVSYVGLIGVLIRWKPPPAEQDERRSSIPSAIAEGVRLAFASLEIRHVLIRTFGICLPASAFMALLPVAARDLYAGDAIDYGILLGGFGAGAAIGAAASGTLRRRLSVEGTITTAALLAATGTAGVSMGSELAVGLVFSVLAGAGWVIAVAAFNVTVQLASPRAIVARMISLNHMSLFASMAIGSWCFGILADFVGVALALECAALVIVSGMSLRLFVPLSYDVGVT